MNGWVEKKCDNCGCLFLKRRSQVNRSITHFCSADCFHKSYSNRRITTCLFCGQTKEMPANTKGKFCSWKCFHAYRAEHNTSIQECMICKKEFKRIKSWTDKRRGYYCSARCYWESLKISDEVYRENRNKATRAYRRKFPERTRAWKNKRRMLVEGLGGEFTPQQWNSLLKQHNGQCVRCGLQLWDKLTVDHIIPVSKWLDWTKQNGEPNYKCGDIENIQPLCSICNSRKSYSIS